MAARSGVRVSNLLEECWPRLVAGFASFVAERSEIAVFMRGRDNGTIETAAETLDCVAGICDPGETRPASGDAGKRSVRGVEGTAERTLSTRRESFVIGRVVASDREVEAVSCLAKARLCVLDPASALGLA